MNIFENKDCMEGMKQFPDNYFDLAIVDPPYGINVNHNMGRRKGDRPSDYKPATWDRGGAPDVDYFKELFRISKNQIVWGANHFISKIPIDSACWLMWDKKFSEDLSFAQYELAWTSFDGVCKKFDKDPKENGRIHPTQKPVQLYKWILKHYANPGDKILDTHVGSASSLIAFEEEKFNYHAFEIDKEYFDAANKRLDQYRSQLKLF
jgi:site-specific DNA-methyltransferase (adenine-specific)